MTDEQTEIIRTLDKIISRYLPLTEQRRRDAEQDPPYHLLPVLGDAGLLSLPFPEELGGLALSWETVALVQHYLGQHAWMLGSLYNRALGFGGMSILSYASKEQQQQLLPAIMRGELLFALALTEPEAGSDAAAIKLSAHHESDGYQLDGNKIWISDAKRADYLIVVARTAKGSHTSEGISLFLVPSNSPGLEITPIAKIGNNCLPSYSLNFDNVWVDGQALLGEEGKGFVHLMSTLHYARAGMAASVSGYAQFAVDLALAHARERQQFGRTIGSFQAIAHRLVDMQMRVDQSWLMARELAWRIAMQRPCKRQAAQAKVVATEALQDVAHHGMQILASAGYEQDSDMARVWRDSRLYTFGEGSNEIQRNIIAKELGLGGSR